MHRVEVEHRGAVLAFDDVLPNGDAFDEREQSLLASRDLERGASQ
jgi:hypothetical protein